jgi:hypothetical protein
MLRVLLLFLVLLLPDIALAAKKLSPAKPADPDMSFVIVRSNSNNCEPNCPEWIEAQGKIVANTSAKFSKLLANPANRRLPIVLNSFGGDLRSALAMGRLIRRYHMNTGIGRTTFDYCDPFADAKCAPSVSNRSHRGQTTEFNAYCFSACPLVLLGGEMRVVGASAQAGLHQPVSISHPYMDRYWETYRLVHGRKKILSRKFIKRITMPSKTSIGITPRLRSELTLYINEMKGSIKIIDEMQKASPEKMNVVSIVEARSLGLASGFNTLLDFNSNYICQKAKPEVNCVAIK